MTSDTKLDESFQIRQFVIDEHNPPFRLDHNCNDGGTILFILFKALGFNKFPI